jgi:hypothetical protein
MRRPSQMRDREYELINCIKEMVNQFAYQLDNPPRITTGGLSALETAFDILGYSDPEPAPERGCQYGKCKRFATCGIPTKSGYKFVCGEHFRKLYKEKEEK